MHEFLFASLKCNTVMVFLFFLTVVSFHSRFVRLIHRSVTFGYIMSVRVYLCNFLIPFGLSLHKNVSVDRRFLEVLVPVVYVFVKLKSSFR